MPKPAQEDAPRAHSKKLRLLALCLSMAILIIAGVLVALNFQSIADTFSSFGYTPSEGIKQIGSSLDLTGDGNRIFLASRPALNTADEFNKSCDAHEENASVLGCFVGREIHIYNIESEQLAGIKESTAAHELLHAVWSRLSQDEKNTLTKELEAVYTDAKHNAQLEEDLKTYGAAERVDELHSRVGTEIKDLPSSLEEHYAKYFKDQDKIVSFYNSYIAPFNELKQQITTLSSELTALKEQIDSKTSEYESRANALNNTISEFNNCANTLDCFTDRATFNARRAGLVAEQEVVNSLYQEVDNMIKEYNAKVNSYNDNVLKTRDLEKLISSKKE